MDKDMITINLFDTSFKHLETPDGIYSMIKDKKPSHIKYVRDKMNFDGITIFTDSFLNKPIVDKVKSKYKIGWIIEPPEITSSTYNNFESYKHKFDFVLTYSDTLLKRFPHKTKFCPFGGSWVPENKYKIYPKSKDVNILYSNKKYATGHKLRHKVAQSFSNACQFGTGANKPFKNVEDVLKDFRFSIVIENDKIKNFFTEKLLNCISVGTIPIYWGCPNIGDFFDKNGIITFNNLEDLDNILRTIYNNPQYSYNLYSSGVKENFNRLKDYDVVENWMYKNIILQLNEKNK